MANLIFPVPTRLRNLDSGTLATDGPIVAQLKGIAWVPENSYAAGDVVTRGTRLFISNTVHTGVTTLPENDTVNWAEFVSSSGGGISLWAPSTEYAVGDVVALSTDDFKLYRANVAHTSAATFVSGNWDALTAVEPASFATGRSVVATSSNADVALDVDPSQIHLNEFAVPNNDIDLGSNLTHRIINSPDPAAGHHVANLDTVQSARFIHEYVTGASYIVGDLIMFVDPDNRYELIEVTAAVASAPANGTADFNALVGNGTFVLRQPDDEGVQQVVLNGENIGRDYEAGTLVWRPIGATNEFRIYKAGGTGGTEGEAFTDVFFELSANENLEAEVDTLSHRRLEDTPGLPPHADTFTVTSTSAISRNQAALTYWFPDTHLGGSIAVNTSFSFPDPTVTTNDYIGNFISTGTSAETRGWIGRIVFDEDRNEGGVTRSYIGISVLPRGTYNIGGNDVLIDSAAYMTANTGANGQIGTLAQLNAVWPATVVNATLAEPGVPYFTPSTDTWTYRENISFYSATRPYTQGEMVFRFNDANSTLDILTASATPQDGNAGSFQAGNWVAGPTFAGGAGSTVHNLNSFPLANAVTVRVGDFVVFNSVAYLYQGSNTGTTIVETRTFPAGAVQNTVQSLVDTRSFTPLIDVGRYRGLYSATTRYHQGEVVRDANGILYEQIGGGSTGVDVTDTTEWLQVGGGTVDELADIGDVTLTSVAAGQVLTRNIANNGWVNATINATGGGGVSVYSDVPSSTADIIADRWYNFHFINATGSNITGGTLALSYDGVASSAIRTDAGNTAIPASFNGNAGAYTITRFQARWDATAVGNIQFTTDEFADLEVQYNNVNYPVSTQAGFVRDMTPITDIANIPNLPTTTGTTQQQLVYTANTDTFAWVDATSGAAPTITNFFESKVTGREFVDSGNSYAAVLRQTGETEFEYDAGRVVLATEVRTEATGNAITATTRAAAITEFQGITNATIIGLTYS